MKIYQVVLDTNVLRAEKISSFMTKKYLEDRGKRGSKKKFMAALARVPDVEPENFDRL